MLVGPMGAGKSTVGPLVADRLGTAFADADARVEARVGTSVAELWAQHGEETFRAHEAAAVAELVAPGGPGVVAVGGGALGRPSTRALLDRRAHVVWLDADPDLLLARLEAAGVGSRPLAADPIRVRALHGERHGTWAAAADAYVDAARTPDEVAAACLLVPAVRSGALARLAEHVGDRRSVLVVDPAVRRHLSAAFDARIELEGGESAKTVEALAGLWRDLAGAELERGDVVVAAGGGTVTDVVGFAAATFRRGVGWIAVPTTLVGQVDAALGGKTAVNVAAKNDVGAFHLPERVVADPDVLGGLPPRAFAEGFAEAVKTGLLAGGPLWDLVRRMDPSSPAAEDRTMLVRRCAAYKTAVVVADPQERGLRAVLNLGHTIGHGVEAAAGYGGLGHGQAVAVGLSAALWLSVRLRGLDATVLDETEAVLEAAGLPLRAPGLDPERVLAAMRSDKKRVAGRVRFVLLEAPGRPVRGVDVPDEEVRAAVERAVVTTTSRHAG